MNETSKTTAGNSCIFFKLKYKDISASLQGSGVRALGTEHLGHGLTDVLAGMEKL